MSPIYSINRVRLAVARELLKQQDLDAAVERVAEQLGLPVEAVREALAVASGEPA